MPLMTDEQLATSSQNPLPFIFQYNEKTRTLSGVRVF